jgi:hypothetical protein
LSEGRRGRLHQDHQRDRQQRYKHHQLEIIDERYGFRLRRHCLGEDGASANGGKTELVAHHLPIRRNSSTSAACVMAELRTSR